MYYNQCNGKPIISTYGGVHPSARQASSHVVLYVVFSSLEILLDDLECQPHC
jgi:hypothetical protein